MPFIVGAPKAQFFQTGTNVPLSGGKVYSYTAGTSTLTATYPTVDDAVALTNANANPIILNSRGEAGIVLVGATKLSVYDSSDVLIYTFDDIYNTSTATNFIYDDSGYVAIAISGATTPVNYITISNANTGSAPGITAAGTDTNVSLALASKGNGNVSLTAGAGNITLTTPTINFNTLALSTADGTNGQVIATNGSGTLAFASTARNITMQVITTTSTYTPTSGMVMVEIYAIGGGGGGGTATAANIANNAAVGSGGGAGGLAFRAFSAAQVGATASIVIGAAGASATAGGATTVTLTGAGAITLTAAGGSSGTNGSNQTAASATQLNAGGNLVFHTTSMGFGNNGTPGIVLPTLNFALGGDGGSSFCGVGGVGGLRTTAGITNGAISNSAGGGGGGGAALQTASVASGGAGTQGAVWIIEYLKV